VVNELPFTPLPPNALWICAAAAARSFTNPGAFSACTSTMLPQTLMAAMASPEAVLAENPSA